VSAPTPNPDLHALLGTYSELIATAMDGIQLVTTKIQEAFEDSDPEHARALNEILEANVAHWRATFRFDRGDVL
jgi:hypothetical protein